MARVKLKAICVAMLLACGAARAEQAAEPLLVVDNGPGTAERTYTRGDLVAMRQVTYRTTTIWTEGVWEFRGVPLSDILKDAGVTGGRLILKASNDYAAEMPVSAVTPDVPLVAMTANGAPMSLRDKGPLWVVYPYDLSTIYQSEVIYTRSVWQLVEIEAVP